jgi:desulfoferrodoxin (superoxide reductase-like protein)
MKTKQLMIALFAAFMLVTLTYFPRSVNAHSPSGITLDYDTETNTLSVDVNHDVSNPNTHFIEKIEVYLNDVLEEERTYTSQETASSKSDTFNIEAIAGDVFKVIAYCNQFGSYEQSLVISDGTTTEETSTTTTTTPTEENGSTYMPLNEIVLVILIGLAVAIIILIWMRKRS